MNPLKLTRPSLVAGLLSAAILLGSFLQAGAEPGKGRGQGKWRHSEKVEKRIERSRTYREPRRSAVVDRTRTYVRDRGREVVVRDRNLNYVVRDRSRPTVSRSYSYQRSYKAPVWRDTRHYTGKRYYRTYGGVPIYREYVYVNVYPRYRPVYGWRYYCPPRYYYPHHTVYVRPVRFFVAADVMIGGVHISGSYADPGEIYGCNFCDMRFHGFHAYERHVEHCSHAPGGYVIVAQDWSHDRWEDWEDDSWDVDDGGYYEGGYWGD